MERLYDDTWRPVRPTVRRCPSVGGWFLCRAVACCRRSFSVIHPSRVAKDVDPYRLVKELFGFRLCGWFRVSIVSTGDQWSPLQGLGRSQPKNPHTLVGVDGLAAARSRHGSDTTPWCHSLPCRRFATSATREKATNDRGQTTHFLPVGAPFGRPVREGEPLPYRG